MQFSNIISNTIIIMVKFSNQSGKSKKVKMGSWLLKVVSRDMKTKAKNKDQQMWGFIVGFLCLYMLC